MTRAGAAGEREVRRVLLIIFKTENVDTKGKSSRPMASKKKRVGVGNTWSVS